MNEQLLQTVAVAIAQAFNLNKQEQVLQIILNMSEEGIKAVIQIVQSNGKDDLKIAAIQQTVQKDLLKSLTAKKEQGGKLEYIKLLKSI